MRLRPLAALSVAAVSALLLAGCAGSGDTTATPEATATVAADLCSSAAPTGAASEGITVSGEVGSSPTVEITTPIDSTDLTLERTITVEGTGDALVAGDFVNYAITVVRDRKSVV